MKKTYIAPQTKEIVIGVANIICTSLTSAGHAVDAGITEADSPFLDILDDYDN